MKKNEYVYPGSDLDRSKVLISLLGTFWSRTYTAIDQVHSYTDAAAYTVAQTHRNLLETVAALSRYDVPLFHEELLYPVVIRKSDVNGARTNIAMFDKTGEQFNGKILFDTPLEAEMFYVPLPEKFRGANTLFNKITFPTIALAEDIDFSVDLERNALVFTANPFENAGFVRRVIEVDGRQDEEITLWAFSGKFDYEYVFNQFAYVLGVHLRTSQNYKDLINAILSGLVAGGLSAKNLDAAISAICGIPLVIDAVETVEVVEYDSSGLLIVTDKNVYRFHENAVPAVRVDAVVHAGDVLIHGLEIKEFFLGNTYIRDNEDPVGRAETTKLLATNIYETIAAENEDEILISEENSGCPGKTDLAALALDNNFLSTCFYGDLVFENKIVPLVVNPNHKSGYTFVQFELGGYPADVERFFNEVHARGIAAAETEQIQCFLRPNEYATFSELPAEGISEQVYKTIDDNRYYSWSSTGGYNQITQVPPFKKLGTLGHLLDKRKQPESEPQPDDLPTKINPLRFLVENVLRNNVFVARINVSALGQNRLGLYNIRHLRQVIPPQTAMIVVFELTAKSDKIHADKFVSEAIDTFIGIEPQLDAIDEEYVKDLGVLISRVSGTCQ